MDQQIPFRYDGQDATLFVTDAPRKCTCGAKVHLFINRNGRTRCFACDPDAASVHLADLRSPLPGDDLRQLREAFCRGRDLASCADCRRPIAPGTQMLLGTDAQPRRVCFRCYSDASKAAS